MNVSDAVLARKSIRAFTKQSVANELVKELLVKSSRAASGGNLQPWKIFVINNKSMTDFLNFQKNWTTPEIPAYEIYPPKLKEPYRSSRFELGEQMYDLLDIGREDKDARIFQVMKNFEEALGGSFNFDYVDMRDGDPSCIYGSALLANSQLNWKAEKNLKDMVASAISARKSKLKN